MHPTLKELQHLVLLAEEQHFARAAKRAFLSQSAFSRSISALEETLGLKLFDRGSRHVQITADGTRIVAIAARLLSTANDLSHEAELLRSGEGGDIVLGAGPYSSVLVMAPVLALAQQQLLKVRIRLEVDHTQALVHKLIEEQIHFFVSDIKEVPQEGPCVVEPLGSYHGAILCRSNHPLAQQKQITLHQLLHERLASVHLPSPIRTALEKAFNAATTKPLNIAFECESVAVLKEITLASDYLLIAPPALFSREIENGDIVELKVVEFEQQAINPLQVNIGLVQLAARTPTSAMRMLLNIVQTHVKATLSNGGQQSL
ncbi:LysR family transcriptional regulator [Lampropedia puyangensis]|uniref:LysR family transcriptional regulator n=1 Tax=Lampropedia puyangensis TaxID=1330072 RepID=A0A4S8F2Q2_9BURK|nr:LysR family transcriptional regulator [Lampropedia puyangensis]THU01031.1 LysR family transcriptional regulator [Lampropedia puyangensis]